MLRPLFFLAAALAIVLGLSFIDAPIAATDPVVLNGDGVVRVKSAYPMTETIDRLKTDIAAKGIQFFDEIDQQALAAAADIELRPSTLLIFGNPPLGTLFITAKAEAGTRLARAPAGHAGRRRQGLGDLHRLRLDRRTPRHRQPPGRIRQGQRGHRLDYRQHRGGVTKPSPAPSRVAGRSGEALRLLVRDAALEGPASGMTSKRVKPASLHQPRKSAPV